MDVAAIVLMLEFQEKMILGEPEQPWPLVSDPRRTVEIVPRLELSRESEMRMSLRWIAIISAHSELSIASTGGTHSAEAALKLIAAGADVVMLASAVLERGPAFVSDTLAAMRAWLVDNDVESVEQMKGSMNHKNCPNPAGFERLNYMKALMSYASQNP